MKKSSDAINQVENKLRSVFRPDDGGDIVDWLEKNIKQIPFSPMPAGFRRQATPWLVEALRAMADPEKRLTMLIAPIQSGKSLAAEMLSCFIIARQPAPTLYLNDQNENASDWMRTRLRVLWENCPPVMAKMPPGEEKAKGDVVQTSEMTFWCLGAYNEKNLQRRSIRWLVADETWLYPKGHLAECSARVTSFGWLGKRIFMSQGGFQGDETEEFWNTTTKSVWSFACPKCDYKQPFSSDQLRIPDDALLAENEYDYNAIRKGTKYECCNCKHHFNDTNSSRDEMNKRAFYAPTNPTAPAHNVGFTWDAVCARNWGMIAEMNIRAKVAMNVTGDSNPMRIFTQKQKAKFWSDAPDDFKGIQAFGDYNQGDEWEGESVIDPSTRKVSNDPDAKRKTGCVSMRFLTVDVQRTGFYCLIRMWSNGGVSRLRRWKFLTSWDDVDTYAKANGVIPALVYADCGDQFDDVIRQCGMRGWTALRGDARSEFNWRITTSKGVKNINKTYGPARLVNAGTGVVRVHHFSNLALKDQLSRLRKMGRHTVPVDCGKEYMEQMESEVRVMNTDGKPMWKRIGKRDNHLWDCEVMQLVAAAAFGLLGEPAPAVEQKPDKPAA